MNDKIIEFIKTNPLLKVISLLIAIALWFFVVSKGRSGIVLDVPIGFKNMPSGIEVIDGAKTVSINVEGQERLLKALREEHVGVVIDLKNSKKGENLFAITPDNIRLPKSLVATKISPQTVMLVLEERLKKEVVVTPIITGSPAEGFLVKSISVTPKNIEIEGPASAVAKVYSVKTEPVDITGIDGDLHYSVNLNMPKRGIRTFTPEVKVSIYVRRIK
ncbi:MAG: YbbR-like domain-containing protein [Nitrospirae bacterium]|nr:YbbR-like domain-containing protein [Nitrospirota bacterium]